MAKIKLSIILIASSFVVLLQSLLIRYKFNFANIDFEFMSKQFHNQFYLNNVFESLSMKWEAFTLSPIIENILIIGIIHELFKNIKNKLIFYFLLYIGVFSISVILHMMVDGLLEIDHGFSFCIYATIFLVFYNKYKFWKAILLCSIPHVISNILKLILYPIFPYY